MALLRMLPWALCAAMVLFSAATYSSLPEAIPQHFDVAGKVTATTPRSPASWAALPIIAVATQTLLSVLSASLVRKPHLFNFPDKDRFLRLPAEYQAPVIERMREVLDAVGIVTAIVFGAVQFMIWRTAMGTPPGGFSIALMVGPILATPGLLVLGSRVTYAVDEAEKRWKANERNRA